MYSFLAKFANKIPDKADQLRARRESNAKCQARRKEAETSEEKKDRLEKEAKAQALKRSLQNPAKASKCAKSK